MNLADLQGMLKVQLFATLRGRIELNISRIALVMSTQYSKRAVHSIWNRVRKYSFGRFRINQTIWIVLNTNRNSLKSNNVQKDVNRWQLWNKFSRRIFIIMAFMNNTLVDNCFNALEHNKYIYNFIWKKW